MALVADISRGESRRTEFPAPPTWTGLDSCVFHAWTVHAALAYNEAYRSGLGGEHFSGAALKTAF